MKRQMLTLVGVLGMLLAAGSASAQTIKVKADVPFNFIINKATLPAGEYTLMSVGTESARALSIRSADKQNQALVLANHVDSRTPCKTSKLIFNRYGDRYFLSQVWVAGNDSGRQLPRSPRETEVAMDYTPQQVIVLADLR